MGTDHQGASTPESEAAEEADWALATAETLLGKGDREAARTWFRRAAEHLMDAGLDDLLFWGSLVGALFIAFWAAVPVNRWLIGRGKGHAVVHAYH